MTRQCLICGKDFEIHNPNHRYCSGACRAKGSRQMAELRGEDFRVKKPKPCTFINSKLSKIAAEAREAGMSYGQYVGLKGI